MQIYYFYNKLACLSCIYHEWKQHAIRISIEWNGKCVCDLTFIASIAEISLNEVRSTYSKRKQFIITSNSFLRVKANQRERRRKINAAPQVNRDRHKRVSIFNIKLATMIKSAAPDTTMPSKILSLYRDGIVRARLGYGEPLKRWEERRYQKVENRVAARAYRHSGRIFIREVIAYDELVTGGVKR